MSFIESPRFPDCVAYGARGGPRFKTRVVQLASGHEQRNIDWSEPLAEYDVSHVNRTFDDMRTLLAFFLSVRGKAYGFRFKDHKDYQVSLSEGVTASLGGSPNLWQLYKRYSYGGIYFDRRITKPVQGSVRIHKNGIEIPSEGSPAGAAIDYTCGHVYIPTADYGDTITWYGEFDVPVRFDTDAFDGTIEELNAVTWDGIKLVEMRMP